MSSFTDFDKAVMVEKAVILNAMIANGTPAQKKEALQQWNSLKPSLIAASSDIDLKQSDVHKGENHFFRRHMSNKY